ncbi:MAG: alpha/beta fold hydrolase [Chloroflexota bacterium]
METPAWLNKELYPFASHTFDVPDGKMHYVDEGEGEPILMVHGTPTWSFLYRDLIKGLRDDYRVIAPDILGFGLSEKPRNYSYQIPEQARNLQALIDHLGLQDFTLIAHDFGGPTSLAYALDNPDNIKRIVLFNTWMWSLKSDLQMRLSGGLIGSRLGLWLYKYANLEFNVIVPSVYGDRTRFTPEIRAHYEKLTHDEPFMVDVEWMYARELLARSDWFDSLWTKREAIQDIPAMLVWGMRDVAFGPKLLARWRTVFSDVTVHELADTGHFVQDEQGAALVPMVRGFLESD